MKIYIKIALLVVVIMNTIHMKSQEKDGIASQKDRLRQYSGQWISAVNPSIDSVAKFPEIKMSSLNNFNNLSLTVEVFQKDSSDQYNPILYEIIGYDSVIDTIFAAGHNAQGAFFTGKGIFTSEKNWTMQDRDLDGNKTMKVDFNFQNYTDVILEGFDTNEKSLWKTRYIKNNPKNKNIGIQLVSVHKEMLNKPEETLMKLGRMGYSYVETFVYNNGSFYGQTPKQFRAMVEKSGMKFLGRQ